MSPTVTAWAVSAGITGTAVGIGGLMLMLVESPTPIDRTGHLIARGMLGFSACLLGFAIGHAAGII